MADRAHLNDVRVVPISSLKGDNVVETSARTPWYTGPSIVEILESIDDVTSVEDAADQALRLPVDYVIRDHDSEYRGFAGRIAAGSVGVGDEVTVTGGRTARITTLSIAGDPVETPVRAVAGSSVSVELDTDIDLSRGALIAGTSHPDPTPSRPPSSTPASARSSSVVGYYSATVHTPPKPNCQIFKALSTSIPANCSLRALANSTTNP